MLKHYVLCVLLIAVDSVIASDTRQILLGDIDNLNYDGVGSVDDVFVEQEWLDFTLAHPATVLPRTVSDFDQLDSDHFVPFTFMFNLDPGESIIGASLIVGLRNTGLLLETDHIHLATSMTNNHEFLFRDLGWPPITETGSESRALNLSNVLGANFIPGLQGGKLNVLLDDDASVDYALFEYEVISGPIALGIERQGGAIRVNWPDGSGVLQECEDLTSPAAWEDAPGSSSSPHEDSGTVPTKYFRLRE